MNRRDKSAQAGVLPRHGQTVSRRHPVQEPGSCCRSRSTHAKCALNSASSARGRHVLTSIATTLALAAGSACITQDNTLASTENWIPAFDSGTTILERGSIQEQALTVAQRRRHKPESITNTASGALPNNDWLAKAEAAVLHAEYETNTIDASRAQRALDQAGYRGSSLPPTWPGSDSVLQAPNRKQNLRTFFLSDGAVIIPRTHPEDDNDSTSWALSLKAHNVGRESIPGSDCDADGDTLSPAPVVDSEQRETVRYIKHGYIERFDNRDDGLEHSIEVLEPPTDSDHGLGGGELVIHVALRGLRASLKNHTEVLLTHPETGEPLLRYHGLAVWDATARPLVARMDVSANRDTISLHIDDSGAIYPIIVDPTIAALELTWTAQSNQASASFGTSVSGAGDINRDGFADVLVGAPGYDNGEADEGRAFLYLGSPSGLSSEPAWTAESNSAGARFGSSVSGAGDVNGDGFADAVIGAPKARIRHRRSLRLLWRRGRLVAKPGMASVRHL